MSEMNEYTPDLYELVDEEGNVKNFELIDAAEIDGEQYYALVPAIEDDDFLNADCELVVLKSVEEDGMEVLASIDDDDEYEKAMNFFFKRIEEAMGDMEDAEFDFDELDFGDDSEEE